MTAPPAAPRKQPDMGSYVGPLAIAIVCTLGAIGLAIYNWPTGIQEARVVSGHGCHGLVSLVSDPSMTRTISDNDRGCNDRGAWTPGDVIPIKGGRAASGQTAQTVMVVVVLICAGIGLIATFFATRRLRRALRERRRGEGAPENPPPSGP